jgi:hypothetical protein
MKRIVMVVACLLMVGHTVHSEEFDQKALKEMITQLGNDSFRVRRKAQKGIVAEIGALQKTFLDMLAKAESKPSDELTKLTDKLKGLMQIMESTDKTSDDPEVTMRMQKILVETYPSFVYEQELELQKLIVAEYKNTALEDRQGSGKMAKANIYSVSNAAVLEICDLRIIRLGVKGSDYHNETDRVPIDYDGGWSSSGGTFSFKARDQKTTCTWKDWSFTIDRRDFLIGARKIRIGEGKNILIVDANGGFKSHFKLSR